MIDETNEGGFAVLREAVARYRAVLGARLVAAYALGSLAHGGFSPLVSDVDLGLVLADPVEPSDPPTIGAVAEAVKAGGTALHERLSVFWGTAETLAGRVPGGRFPPLDRLDLLENGLLLDGEECRQGLTGPEPAELLVEGAEFALDFLGPGHEQGSGPAGASLGSLTPAGDDVIDEVRRPELLVKRDTRHLTKIVLFPVRFLFTAATGRVGTNHAAVDYYLANPEAVAPALVAAGLHWRTVPPDDQPAAVALLERELRPLYLEYIDDHTTRLEDAGRTDLAAAFTAWRRRLTG